MVYAYLAALGWEARPLIYALELLTQNSSGDRIDEAYLLVTPIERVRYMDQLIHARIEVERILTHRGIKVEYLELGDPYDIPSTVASLIRLLRKLSEEGYKAFINLTTGRKTMSLALYLAGCFQASAVKRMIYLSEEEQRLVDIPYMPISILLNAEERKILQVLKDDVPGTITYLHHRTRIPRHRLYRVTERLINRGLLELSLIHI